MSVKLTSKAGGLEGSISINASEIINITESGNVDINGTGHLKIPTGTSAQRSGTPAVGMLRYNSDLAKLESYHTGGWANALGAGSVLQVVQGTLTTYFATTSTEFVDVGLSATITPISTSSKILVEVSAWGSSYEAVGSEAAGQLQILRGSTTIQSTGWYTYAYGATEIYNEFPVYLSKLDSPATDSAVTYKAQMLKVGDYADLYCSAGMPAVIILTEIAG